MVLASLLHVILLKNNQLAIYMKASKNRIMQWSKSLLVYSLFLFPGFLISQTIIEIDIESNQTRYIRDGEIVDKAIVKNGETAELVVLNYNNYLYDVEIEKVYRKHNTPNAQGLTEFSLAGVSDLFGGNILPPSLPNLDPSGKGEPYSPPGFEVEADEAPGKTIDFAPMQINDEASLELWKKYEEANLRFEKEKLEINRQNLEIENERRQEEMIVGLVNKLDQKINRLYYIESSFYENRDHIQKFAVDDAFVKSAGDRISSLKHNGLLSVSMIKTESNKIFTKALNVDYAANIKDVSLPDTKSQIADLEYYQMAIKRNQDEYLIGLEESQFIYTELQIVAENRANVRTSGDALQTKLDNFNTYNKEVEQTLKSSQSLIEAYKDRDPKMLDDLWYGFQELNQNSFSKRFKIEGKDDEIEVRIKLKLKEDIPDSKAPLEMQPDPVKMSVYGDFKINTSVGVNFAQFFNPVQSYFIRNGTIVGENGDAFIPLVTTNVHFYFQSHRSWHIGGTMGVGVPLGGNSSFESASFLFGPSLFIGKTSRLIINTGIMGGKVDRLGAGYKIGDPFDNDPSFIPLKAKYDLGAFVGVSYNLGGA